MDVTGEKCQQEEGKADRGGGENPDRVELEKQKKSFHKKAVIYSEKDNRRVRKYASFISLFPILNLPNQIRD